MIIKRFVDILFSSLAILLLLPVFFILSALIFIFLGRPIFFTQKRPGLRNKTFKIIKFRTMKIPSDSEIEDSQRITNLGKFLRSYSLDEIPEFFNVLKGNMSLVGPRPLLEEYLELYSKEQLKRHDVLPGITGWAQINGRNNISWEEKLELDIWYVENKSTFLDLKIIFLTFWKVLTKKDTSPSNKVTMDKFKGSKN